MVGHERFFNGISIKCENKNEITDALQTILPYNTKNQDVVFVCIGTDRLTGDSFAPLIGTKLSEAGYQNVYGTIDQPVHAENLQDILNSLPKDKKVIAIDACLGSCNNVGRFDVIRGSIKAGAGVGKNLPECGDYSITGTVNVGTNNDYSLNFQVLQVTRLSRVIQMANIVANAIKDVLPLQSIKFETNNTYLKLVR